MDDLDLRLVHAFCVLAEHLHFGRAAAELHLAQPALSRQIRRLEARVGVPLFERDTRGTHLTAAGAVFLPGAREASAERPVSTRDHPRAVSSRAKAAPIPDVAPVTSARRSTRCPPR